VKKERKIVVVGFGCEKRREDGGGGGGGGFWL